MGEGGKAPDANTSSMRRGLRPQLPRRLEQDNGHRGRQIQTAHRTGHRDGERLRLIAANQVFREALGLLAKDKAVPRLKANLIELTGRMGREIKGPFGSLELPLPKLQILVGAPVQVRPVIEPRPLQLPIFDGKAQGLHQV